VESNVPENIAQHAGFAVEFYYTSTAVKTPFELYRLLKQAMEVFGFSNYCVLYIPEVTEEKLRSNFMATTWPAELQNEYDRLNLLANSPIIAKLRTLPEPITFDLEKNVIDRPEAERNVTLDLFLRHNMPRGVYFPCHDPAGRRGAVGFFGSRQLPSATDLALLHLLSLHAFSHLYLLMRDQEETVRLSARERECLIWTARGKTSAECAVIMGVAESTVVGYIAALSRKMRAQNKTHMVAIAFEKGLLTHPNDRHS
jgi:LuxR family quorum sensing-dependent transcriptional regulator